MQWFDTAYCCHQTYALCTSYPCVPCWFRCKSYATRELCNITSCIMRKSTVSPLGEKLHPICIYTLCPKQIVFIVFKSTLDVRISQPKIRNVRWLIMKATQALRSMPSSRRLRRLWESSISHKPFLKASIFTSLLGRADGHSGEGLAVGRRCSRVWGRGGRDTLVPCTGAVYTHWQALGKRLINEKTKKEGERRTRRLHRSFRTCQNRS